MPAKLIAVGGIGTISLYRKRGTKRLTLRLAHDGTIRVTMPMWAPQHSAISFVQKKREWINKHRTIPTVLTTDTEIGKAHRLAFRETGGSRISTRLQGNLAVVSIPSGSSISSRMVQSAAEKVIIRALMTEAENILPQRLSQLARKYDYQYKNVKIKKLKSRWGSCSDKGVITLNCYLMQLPWRLIDYVLVHELVHTRVQAHNAQFWQMVSECVPDLVSIRKEMRKLHPGLQKTAN